LMITGDKSLLEVYETSRNMSNKENKCTENMTELTVWKECNHIKT
jgi:hypothetical protein